jgi:hypothetical protein
VNDEILLGEKLERTVSFHIDGVPKVAVNCWEHGNDDTVFMVVGCFFDLLADCEFRYGELLLESSDASISTNWLTNFKHLGFSEKRSVHQAVNS